MKRLLAVMMVVLMLGGCGSKTPKVTKDDSLFTTSDGYKVEKYTMMAIVEKAVEDFDRQSKPKVKSDIKVTLESPVEVNGKDNPNVYLSKGTYTWENKVYEYRLVVAFADEEGRYKYISYENPDTGTKRK